MIADGSVPFWLFLFVDKDQEPLYAKIYCSSESASDVIISTPNWKDKVEDLFIGEYDQKKRAEDVAQNFKSILAERDVIIEGIIKDQQEVYEAYSTEFEDVGSSEFSYLEDIIEAGLESKNALELEFPALTKKFQLLFSSMCRISGTPQAQADEIINLERRNSEGSLVYDIQIWSESIHAAGSEEIEQFYEYHFREGANAVANLEAKLNWVDEQLEELRELDNPGILSSLSEIVDWDERFSLIYDLTGIDPGRLFQDVAMIRQLIEEIELNSLEFPEFFNAAREKFWRIECAMEPPAGLFLEITPSKIPRTLFPDWLYRAYDEDGALLYVGITVDPLRRFLEHSGRMHGGAKRLISSVPVSTQSVWFSSMERITFTPYIDNQDLKRAEVEAIKAENPIYNIVHGTYRKVRTREIK